MTTSDLRSHIGSYLELRQSLGFKTRYQGNVLRAFADYLDQHGHQGPLLARTAVEWAAAESPRKAGPPGQRIRLIVLRGFMRHLKVFFPDTHVPVPGVLARVPRQKPYIYSQEEISNLQETAFLLWKPGSMRQHVMCTLIGLLTCTGLRASEALGLTLDDLKLDLDPPYILIRNTKFYKSRFVPIHSTTTEKLRLYLQMRKQLCPSSSSKAVFLNDTGEPLRYHNALSNFRAITHQLSIQSTAGRKQPALHALRHTFAVARLVSWHYAGLDVRTLLPHLSVYLGHVSLEETYWYLTATPELLTAASALFESHVDSGCPNE